MIFIHEQELESSQESLREFEALMPKPLRRSSKDRMLDRWREKRLEWARMRFWVGWLTRRHREHYNAWVALCDRFIELLEAAPNA